MKQRPRIYYTESQKAVMWDRWQKGESLQKIAVLLIETTHPYNGFWRRQAEFVQRNDVAPDWR